MHSSQETQQQLLACWIEALSTPAFTAHPSMSFRTVVPNADRRAPMVKLPVALRLTSMQRTVSPRSARMGPRISQLLLQILDREAQFQRPLNIVPERIGLHDPLMTLYDQPGFVRDKLLHTTFMCHLGELALLCARYWDVPQGLLWDELTGQVSVCFDSLRERVEPQRWARERQALLTDDWPAKSFIRMRLLDSHADIVGRLSNPLRAVGHAD